MMGRWNYLSLTVFMILASNVYAEVPRQIAGFVLGENISEYADRLRMESMLPIRHAEYLKEVEIGPIPGYKSGLVVFGDCKSPGRIVRLKLKYANPSEKFFNQLLEKIKMRFGKPDKWRGDPFHVMLAWKWSFEDEKGNRVGMILQHNAEDSTEKLGNVIKLYMYNMVEEEMECFEKKHPDQKASESENTSRQKGYSWDDLIPK
jgi:hypothetical protein